MHFGFGGFGMGLGMILFWVVLIGAIVLLARDWSGSSKRNEPQPQSPIDVLKRRYAAGEITRGEFQDKKRELIQT
jgi:putative membrane protein